MAQQHAEEQGHGEKNISYVLLAEFDIDKGSTVKHQYPQACPVSENVLADLMLPEGAHLRESDWTIFFLRDGDTKQDKQNRRMTKVDKWTNNRKKLIKDINSCNVTAQVLEFSESVNDWFIMHDVAKLSFSYNGKWTVSTQNIPEIEIKLAEMDNPTNTINSTAIDEEMQFTLLSDEDLFCSFYPSNGNAIGLKFLEMNDMKKIQDLIQQILEPEPKPQPTKADIEKEKQMNKEKNKDENANKSKLNKQLSVLNLVRTQKDDSVRRGAIVKALAVCTHLQVLESFKPLLTLALDNYFRNESLDGLKNLYETLNGVSFSNEFQAKIGSHLPIRQYSLYNAMAIADHVPIGSPKIKNYSQSSDTVNISHNSNKNKSGTASPADSVHSNEGHNGPNGSNNDGGGSGSGKGNRSRVGSMSYESRDSGKQGSETFTVPIKFNSINMHLTVPKRVGVDEITGVSVKSFFEKFKRNLAIIYNAVFTQKRVIFLGHNEPSAKVCNMALAVCLLTSPAIEGSLERCYPYACLTSMQFLQVPGYIAGVTNPIFEQRQEWYDLLCNVTNGEIKLSDKYREQLDAEQANYGKVIQCDKQFTLEIKNGMSMKYGESWLRNSFQDYSDHIVKMALGNEVFETKEAEMNEYSINEWRINEWKKTESYQKMVILYEKRDLMSPFGKETKKLNKMIRTLQIRPLAEDEGIEYFVHFNKLLDSEKKVEYFISLLKPSLGGLLPIVSYMCHRNLDIQSLIVDIITKLESYKIGKKMVATLNFFFVCNYHRLKCERALGINKEKKLKQNQEYQRKKAQKALANSMNNQDGSGNGMKLPPKGSLSSTSSNSILNNNNNSHSPYSNDHIETDGSGHILPKKSSVSDMAKRFSGSGAVLGKLSPKFASKQSSNSPSGSPSPKFRI